MVLLKHGDFEFSNILSGGYVIDEDVPNVLAESVMADGSIRRNYGMMPKTQIKVKFGRLNKETYYEYLNHFSNNEDEFSYYSPRKQTMLTKRFFVERPEASIIYADDSDEIFEELEIVLKQIGE